MMPNPVHVAFSGAALAAAAVVMLALAVLFDGRFLKSEQEFRSWMDAILWCMVLGLFATAAVAAWAVVQLHH